jgi:alpha-beta hydrolase superfamily lysophospholipase
MDSETFRVEADDEARLFVRCWQPPEADAVNGAVLVLHGMAEHGGRYRPIGQSLADAGYAVYAGDHRGHGETAGSLDRVGYFSDSGGWDQAVDDICRIVDFVGRRHLGLPLFLLGHSMGSFLARSAMQCCSDRLAGVVLSATGAHPGLLGRIGALVARVQRWLQGPRRPSRLLHQLTFGGFNKPFKPNRTDFDWLSRDTSVVDDYIADPYCGGIFSAGFYVDLIQGVMAVNSPAHFAAAAPHLPLLLFSGTMDPVGGGDGSGVRQVADAYRQAGMADVELHLYPEGRHEMLNEINRQEVVDDLLAWLQRRTMRTTPIVEREASNEQRA